MNADADAAGVACIVAVLLVRARIPQLFAHVVLAIWVMLRND